MTAFARRVIERQSIPSLFNVDELKSKTTLQLLQERFAPYISKTVSELTRLMNIRSALIRLLTQTLLAPY